MELMRARHAARIVGLALAALALAVPSAAAKDKSIDVQLLGINDFHGQLEPATGSGGRIGPAPVKDQPRKDVDAGGAEYLATHIKNLEEHQPNSLVVAAGDLIGATPLLSAAFHDEPTIEAMNKIGLDVSSVGNHAFQGADFKYLSANVVYKDTGRTLFRPYVVKRVGGARIGFIGLTLKGTPLI